MDERLVAAAGQSVVVRRLAALVTWVGEGRRLTQTGRVTLADARALVELLGASDVIDPKIGDRVFRTTSSEELFEVTLFVAWAKAAGLLRVVKGRLLPVKKSAALVGRPVELWERAFEAFTRLGEAVCPPGWAESLLRREFARVMTVLVPRLYGGPMAMADACALAWETATAPYVIDDVPEEHRRTWRRVNDRDLVRALRVLETLGAVQLAGGEDEGGPAAVSVAGSGPVARDGDEGAGAVELTELGYHGVRQTLGEVGPGEPVYQIRVTLLETREPLVWRRLVVSAGIRLDRLHRILQQAMGWDDSHLHVFTIGEDRYGHADPELGFRDERAVGLADLVTGEGVRIGYTYDFGDDWQHEITVEETLTAQEGVRYPLCLDGQGACPPEDCGGVPGYEHLQEVLADPDDPEHEEMLTWLGIEKPTDFDPDAFDPQQVNQALARAR